MINNKLYDSNYSFGFGSNAGVSNEPSLDVYLKNFSIINACEDTNEYEIEKNKTTNIFLEIFKLNKDEAISVTNTIYATKKYLNNGQAIVLKASEDFGYDIIVTTNLAFCLLKQIGEGTYSHVYETIALPLNCSKLGDRSFSPSKSHSLALKMSKGTTVTYSPEKKKIDSLHKLDKAEIDYPLATFKANNGVGFSVHQLYPLTIDQIEFHKCQKPALQIIYAILSIINPLIKFHDEGWIHKDVKAENIVAYPQENLYKTALSDFTFLDKESSTSEIGGTISHLDPAIFGSLDDFLVNQKRQRGCQTKQSDIYALSQTIIQEILFDFIKEKSKDSAREKAIINELNELKLKSTQSKFWYDDELVDLGTQYPYHATYLHDPTYEQRGEIIIYPSYDKYKSIFSVVFKLLDDCLSEVEINSLTKIALLACEMRNPKLEHRPTALKVKTMLGEILLDYNNAHQKPSTSTNTREQNENHLKRKIENENIDSSTRKRLNL